MALFNWVSRKQVDDCARILARDFSTLCPLSGENAGKATVAAKKVEGALNQIFTRAKSFRQENRLGVLKRARLAKTFQDELMGLGYPPEVINKVTTALVATALTAD